jgi:SAM-dependent methyltransferase
MSQEPGSVYTGTELGALSAAKNYHRWILSKFEPYFGNTVAEVGAGIGTVSKLMLRSPGRTLIAFEPSPNMFPYLAESLQGETRARAINDCFEPRYVPDGVESVVYINVLEHIADDRGELAKAYQALQPSGHLLVFAPAHNWLYSDFDRRIGHIRRYTKRGLVELVQGAGFELVKAQYFDIVGILPWYLSFVLLKGHPRKASVATYDKLVVPPMRLLESIVRPPIGKSVLLIARKVAQRNPARQ